MKKIILAMALILVAAFSMNASAESSEGTFIVRCNPVKTGFIDPIVSPGTTSMHLHQFFGNSSINPNSTLASMTSSGAANCKDTKDTSATWMPALEKPDGTVATPEFSYDYYKTIPTSYSTTRAFPPDFRMIAGGANFSKIGGKWDCREGSPSGSSPIPLCPNGHLQVRLKFPNCWDGVNLDSPNHMSHVVYPVKNACPSGFPVKLPLINFFVVWPAGSGGPGWHLSDQGMMRADGSIANGIDVHADYWNTWQQSALENLVSTCLNAGKNCGQVTG